MLHPGGRRAGRSGAGPTGAASTGADEDVRTPVGVARHQVGGVRPKATRCPSAEIVAPRLLSFPLEPSADALTRSVVPSLRSRTNTSQTDSSSSGPRLSALE